mmetsp:Transcript_5493/g.10453  ORF Transcript_5493/g.10453 Transcript_5493/m.10453 type:complete len:211 (+) Transcript_5493:234-866(+)
MLEPLRPNIGEAFEEEVEVEVEEAGVTIAAVLEIPPVSLRTTFNANEKSSHESRNPHSERSVVIRVQSMSSSTPTWTVLVAQEGPLNVESFPPCEASHFSFSSETFSSTYSLRILTAATWSPTDKFNDEARLVKLASTTTFPLTVVTLNPKLPVDASRSIKTTIGRGVAAAATAANAAIGVPILLSGDENTSCKKATPLCVLSSLLSLLP